MLVKNMVLEWMSPNGPARIERVLWTDAAATHAMTIHIRDRGDLQDVDALPELRSWEEIDTAILKGQAKILDADPYAAPLLLERQLTEKQRARRDRLWAAITPLVQPDDVAVFDRTKRGKLIAAVVRRTGLTRPTIYAALRRYWQRGMTANALVPDHDKCGGIGKPKAATTWKRGRPRKSKEGAPPIIGINIDAAMQRIFETAFQKLFLEEKRTLRGAYQRMLEVMLHRGYTRQHNHWVPVIPPEAERPSFEQFRYWCKKKEEQDRLAAAIKRKGKRRVMLEDRAVLGRSTTGLPGPGLLFQVDATVADVHLVDESRTHNIGRPVFYVVIDVFSRLIVGFYLGLEHASWEAASFALVNTVSKKSPYCRTFGIEIPEAQWPSHHLPRTILADGGEFAGVNAGTLSRYLGVEVKIAPPFRADWKGIVERNFGLMNREIHWLPGAVRGPYKRGERDPRHDAALTLSELRQIMIWCIWEHNNYYRMPWYELDDEMIRDRVLPFPVNLWTWGIRRRAGYLREQHPDTVRMALLPEEEASITREGILFKKLYYTCPKAEEEQWFVQAGMEGRWRVPVAYDRHAHVDSIHLRLQRGRDLIECHLLPKDESYKGRTWMEVEDLFARRAALAVAAIPTELQGNAVAHTAIGQIAANAEQAAKAAREGLSKRACLNGQEEYRHAALTHDRNQRTASPPGPADGVPAELADVAPPREPIADVRGTYVPPVSGREALRKQREEGWQHDSSKP